MSVHIISKERCYKRSNEGLLVWTRKLSHKQLIIVFSKHFRLIYKKTLQVTEESDLFFFF